MWNCPKCCSKVDDEFEICWNCGTSQQGEVHPDFVRQVDSGEEEDSLPIIRCAGCGYVGKVLLKQVDAHWSMLPLSVILRIAGPIGGIAGLWMNFIWYKTCPQCGSQVDLHETSEQPSLAAELIWEQALAESTAGVDQKSQWRLLIFLLIVLAIILTVLYFAYRPAV